ncbi:MAG: 16S rRNA (cytosine(1402)-N(4))-methyltransferase RsmH [Arcanobacterium sp.]|nr:16S rRNA (cytosine(1402)-N(4))-methyltransferase RsmH [Arcanobacterium sp.]
MSSQVLNASGDALHQPVLRELCVRLFDNVSRYERPVLIDGTLGMGGHTEAFLTAYPNLTVIGIDRDPEAISLANERLQVFGNRFHAVHATYDQISQVWSGFQANNDQAAGDSEFALAGIFLDLGVSSLQLDQQERGFSYAHDAPLDMRMNQQESLTAAEILAKADKAELIRILREFGEEKFAGQIAQEIVRARAVKPLESTFELVDLVRKALPAAAMRQGGNPAKRTFQALRIAVNRELQILKNAIETAIELLPIGSRLVVESYQSLEDRIVKTAFKSGLHSSTPLGLPIELSDHQAFLKELVRGAYKADAAEIAQNSRSASVRLRAVERIRQTPNHFQTQTKTGRGGR